MHALIIEQEALIILMIEDVLRDAGFRSFDFAWTVQDAVAAARRRCPDLITSDVRLGAGTGIEAVQDICSSRPLPVVFVTATAWEVRQRLTGAQIVQKPFSGGDLHQAVTRALTAEPELVWHE